MSIENVIIYFLLPVLGYILIKLNRIEAKVIPRLEKKIVMLLVMLRDRGYKIPDETDTEIFLKSNNL